MRREKLTLGIWIEVAIRVLTVWGAWEWWKTLRGRLPRWGENRPITTKDTLLLSFDHGDPFAFDAPINRWWRFTIKEIRENSNRGRPKEYLPTKENRWHVYRAQDEYGRSVIAFPVPFFGVVVFAYTKMKGLSTEELVNSWGSRGDDGVRMANRDGEFIPMAEFLSDYEVVKDEESGEYVVEIKGD